MTQVSPSAGELPKKHFFISLQHADRAWGDWVAWQLAAAGYNVVYQYWDFLPGTNFGVEMQKASLLTTHTLALLSPDYFSSTYAQAEWIAAWNQDPTGEKRMLIPVRIRPCEPPGMLGPITYIDLVDIADEHEARTKLLTGVQERQGKPEVQPPYPFAAPSFARAPHVRPLFPPAMHSQPSGESSSGARFIAQSGPTKLRLPHEPGRLIGRQDTLSRIVKMLHEVRLVTLTGAAGAGKTRLAVTVAATVVDAFSDGVIFVDLTSVSDASRVLTQIAETLGTRESLDSAPLESVLREIDFKSILLVIDGFEHVQSAGADLSAMLEDPRAARLKLLVTSRERLRLRLERPYEVPPLGLPENVERIDAREALRAPAVQLFSELARARQPSFKVTDQNSADVVDICRRTGGLPLALALVAPEVAYVEAHELLGRLKQALPTIAEAPRDAPPRHRTMHSAIAWSYDRLEPADQTLFRRISVFVGGCTVDLVRSVADLDALGDALTGGSLEGDDVVRQLGTLVEKNLLQRVPGGGEQARYRMLEPMRDFGEEKLEEYGEAEVVRQRFAQYFVDLASQTEPRLSGKSQVTWLNIIDLEYANLDAVLQRLVKVGDAVTGLRLTSALWRFWYLRSRYLEGRTWLEAFLNFPPAGGQDASVQATALNGLGSLAYMLADYPTARRSHEGALGLRREMRDQAAEAGSLNNLALVLRATGELEQAATYLRIALDINTRLHNRAWIATNLNNLGNLLRDRRQLDEAVDHQRRSLELFEALGDKWGKGMALRDLAFVHTDLGAMEDAAQEFEQSLPLSSEVGDRRGTSLALMGLAYVHIDHARFSDAHKLLVQSLDMLTALKDLWATAQCLEALGILAAKREQRQRAVRLLEAASRVRVEIGAPRTPNEQSPILQQSGVQSLHQLERDIVHYVQAKDLAQLVEYARAREEPPQDVVTIANRPPAHAHKAQPPSTPLVNGQTPAAPTRLVVVDDDRGYRETVRDVYLAPFRDQVTVLGEAGTCEDALAVVRETRPDVLLLDLSLPQRAGLQQRARVQNGIATIKALKHEVPALPILVLSHHDEGAHELVEAIRAGALGYVSKRDVIEGEQLIGPINKVKAGQTSFGQSILDVLRDYLAVTGGSEATAEDLITHTNGPAASGLPPSESVVKTSTRIVDVDGSGSYTTITQAIAAALTGDRILVRQGHYSEHLVISKPLEIVADGSGEVIIESQDASTVRFEADWGRLERLNLRQGDSDTDHCLEITAGTLEVRSCDLTSRGRSGVAVSRGANPSLRGNRIHGCRLGVWITDNSKALLEDNDITGNDDIGILITEGASPTLRRNRIRANGQGVLIAEGGAGVLDDNEVSGSQVFGVVLNSRANPELTRNEISNNSNGGVAVKAASGLFEANDIHDNSLVGIAVMEGGVPLIRNNTIRDNRGLGVCIVDDSRAELVDNRIMRNTAAGVEIRAGSRPVIRSNRIKQNHGEGVRVHEFGGGVVELNDLRENDGGCWSLPAHGAPLLTRNQNSE